MTPPNTYELRMDPNNMATLIEILKRNEERCKALAKLRHTTEAETVVLIGEAAVCQYAYLQLEGVYYENPTGAPDWSAAEASGKLASEALAAIVEPTPAPADVALPYDWRDDA